MRPGCDLLVRGVFAAAVALGTACTPMAACAQQAIAVAGGAAPDASPPDAPSEEPGLAKGFARDVLGDYVHFFSVENATWLSVGGAASLALHPADEPLQEHATEPGAPSLGGGSVYGSQKLAFPVAIGLWAVGHVAGSTRAADAGRDLVRAQISVFSWTYAIKLATDRTRPNGDPHSFPSGHASTSFATAMVLQQHFGWKVGIPLFAASAYTGASRIYDNQHWLTDVMFGAVLGMVSGRTVTLHVRETRVTLSPVVQPGVAAVQVVAWRTP